MFKGQVSTSRSRRDESPPTLIAPARRVSLVHNMLSGVYSSFKVLDFRCQPRNLETVRHMWCYRSGEIPESSCPSHECLPFQTAGRPSPSSRILCKRFKSLRPRTCLPSTACSTSPRPLLIRQTWYVAVVVDLTFRKRSLATHQDVVKVGITSNNGFLSYTKLAPCPDSQSTLQISGALVGGNWTAIDSFALVNNTIETPACATAAFNTR